MHVRIKRRRKPIHAEYFHSGGATTLSFVVKGTNAVGSFVMHSISWNMVVHPDNTNFRDSLPN